MTLIATSKMPNTIKVLKALVQPSSDIFVLDYYSNTDLEMIRYKYLREIGFNAFASKPRGTDCISFYELKNQWLGKFDFILMQDMANRFSDVARMSAVMLFARRLLKKGGNFIVDYPKQPHAIPMMTIHDFKYFMNDIFGEKNVVRYKKELSYRTFVCTKN